MRTWAKVMETVVRERRPALVGYAYLMTGSRVEAEDLVQDAIVRTFARGRAKNSVVQAEAYIKRAIANEAINRARHRMVVEQRKPLVATPYSVPGHESMVSARADLEAALEVLSPRERAVTVLKYVDDLTIASIAAILKLSDGTVKRYLANAAVKLREQLGDDAVNLTERNTVPVILTESRP
ncbi:MAG: sigma-70 family RNA polymerase sigma factor [Demequina sp.]|uniref:RNA polymerase sigma factor n=1 Tax=Demequina sp. TaxID=2050685 RepID=UPI001986D727|nr:sigma-70 family RNA polymerase sigma factor [Demequina sp.]MBC7297707.1 sigma-70 family RNA polymerase sigma factor [Demequina sp.]